MGKRVCDSELMGGQRKRAASGVYLACFGMLIVRRTVVVFGTLKGVAKCSGKYVFLVCMRCASVYAFVRHLGT